MSGADSVTSAKTHLVLNISVHKVYNSRLFRLIEPRGSSHLGLDNGLQGKELFMPRKHQVRKDNVQTEESSIPKEGILEENKRTLHW